MKGQGALEYLMTYGWALLIIVVVGASLYALGVLNVDTYQQDIKETSADFCNRHGYNYWDYGTKYECWKILENEVVTTREFAIINGTHYWVK